MLLFYYYYCLISSIVMTAVAGFLNLENLEVIPIKNNNFQAADTAGQWIHTAALQRDDPALQLRVSAEGFMFEIRERDELGGEGVMLLRISGTGVEGCNTMVKKELRPENKIISGFIDMFSCVNDDSDDQMISVGDDNSKHIVMIATNYYENRRVMLFKWPIAKSNTALNVTIFGLTSAKLCSRFKEMNVQAYTDACIETFENEDGSLSFTLPIQKIPALSNAYSFEGIIQTKVANRMVLFTKDFCTTTIDFGKILY
jgi:hypothetical protein